MVDIKIEKEIKDKIPQITLGCLEAQVQVKPASEELKTFIGEKLAILGKKLTPEIIRNSKNVKTTKEAYKALGKDPNRYRPSAESLMRRIANRKGLYQISNTVDILNYISVNTGYSICGYDTTKIDGNITLGTGAKDEPYEGIGRGTLNIENLPVFRDSKGAFGTPTSDSVRTMISETTEEILFIFIDLDHGTQLDAALQETKQLLEQFAHAININIYKL